MISVNVIDQTSRQAFPTFIHNTTTYVGVAHEAGTLLSVTSEHPCILTLEAENQTLFNRGIEIPAWGSCIELSALKQPQLPSGGFDFASLLPWGRKRVEPQRQHTPRLYAFRAMIASAASPEILLSTVDFHLLCLVDYRWAEALHGALLKDPQALGSETIWERAEGTCPVCAEVRARLQKDWRPKDEDNG